MRKPKKEKTPRRIGGMISPSVDDASRVKLNQHLELYASAVEVVAAPPVELSEAKAKMDAAKKVFMADPSTENKLEAKYAREEWEKAEKTHFLTIDKDDAFKQVRNKMMSFELKAEELKKRIQQQPAKRLECQSRADGMGVLKCDQETTKLEGQYALAIHEANRYKSLMGQVMTGAREGVSFSESEDFGQACMRADGSVYGTSGQCRLGKPTTLKPDKPKRVESPTHRAKVGLGVRIRNAERKGDKSLAAKLREERMALSMKSKQMGKVTPVAERQSIKLKNQKQVDKDAKAAELRAKVEAAKAQGRAKAAKEVKEKGATGAMRDAVREGAGLKMVEDSKKAPSQPDPFYGAWSTKDLERHERYLKAAGAQVGNNLKGEIARRKEGKSPVKEEQATTPSQFPKVGGLKGYDPQKQFRDPKSETLGTGAMGTVRFAKGPPPAIVKSGELGQYEARALELMKGTGRAPELYGQQLSRTAKEGQVEEMFGGHVRSRKGYLAMSQAEGQPLQSLSRDIGGRNPKDLKLATQVADEYIRTRADIHRRGIAHNDLHAGNFFFDKKTGKGSAVDFGLSVAGNPKMALLEGLGMNKADWQSERIYRRLNGGFNNSEVYSQFVENRQKVLRDMRKNHKEAWEYMSEGGIRFTEKSEGLNLSSLPASKAQEYIEMLYEGI